MPKIGKMEARARAACANYAQNDGGSFAVIWSRSNTWGFCPRIDYHGEKAAHASGCGYDKLSAVVSEFLHHLAPSVRGTGGAGIQTVQSRARVDGWELSHDYNGKQEDGFTLRRVDPASPRGRLIAHLAGGGTIQDATTAALCAEERGDGRPACTPEQVERWARFGSIY